MCGYIFSKAPPEQIGRQAFKCALEKMAWRGPDAMQTLFLNNDFVKLGHVRLSILDLLPRSDQPMKSSCGRYLIVYNGEIYNHLQIRKQLSLCCFTASDTETLLEGFAKIGKDLFPLLSGMFSLVIYDLVADSWVAARDAFGIKPMYAHLSQNTTVIASEPSVVALLVSASVSTEAIEEWRVIRRPIPGKSFFSGVDEVLPGTWLDSNGNTQRFWKLAPPHKPFNQEEFECLLSDAIKLHDVSDVSNVALLSGGLDSAVITAVSFVQTAYTVGLEHNNEFLGAAETATLLKRNLINVSITQEQLIEAWKTLTRLRGEPLGLPNEGLIYLVCKAMKTDEKVVLTGEGADELLFGYDGLYRWAASNDFCNATHFLNLYGYSNDTAPTRRLLDYVDELKVGKTNIEFTEDFFYFVHLPGLLRRMDFASMAASKEARVPFVCKELVEYMYRRPHNIKLSDDESKIPLRRFASKLGLLGALGRKKIGFSAQIKQDNTRFLEYRNFQDIILGALSW
jgi:asparagine synthase (glutamine-hydrolysing)